MISPEYLEYVKELQTVPQQDFYHELVAEWEELPYLWSSAPIPTTQLKLLYMANVVTTYLIKQQYYANMADAKIKLSALHINKNNGYSGNNPDAWSNFREVEKFGLKASEGCLTRLSDKFRRATNLLNKSGMDNVGENVYDTLIDFLSYSLILICLLNEEQYTKAEQQLIRDGVYRTNEALGNYAEG